MDEPLGDDDLWVPDKLRGVGRRRNGGVSDAPSDWLPEPQTPETSVEREELAAERAEPETAEWLVVPESEPAPEPAEPSPREPTDERDEADESAEPDQCGEPDERLAADGERAARAEERAQEVESMLRDAELRIDRLEASLRGAETERRRLERAVRAATERAAAAAGAGKRDESGRLELNTASVEGLRGLGLSITQAARLVANREARGGFASLDELDAVPGLPSEQRAELRERVYVDASMA
jgi:DNA uptake protein ComE-like DNA-binding protein